MLVIDKNDSSIDFLTKVEGLSNAGINRLKFNRFSDILIIVYDNSVIDLVKPDEIITMNQIRNFSNLIGGKTINGCYG